MKRFISLFIILSLSVLIFSAFTFNNANKTRKSQDYLQLAKEEIEKGNFDKAKIYLENCFKFNLNIKEAKALYSELKKGKVKPANLCVSECRKTSSSAKIALFSYKLSYYIFILIDENPESANFALKIGKSTDS